MKNTFKYILAFTMGLAALSCNKTLEKADVEAGFADKTPVPTVSEVTVDEIVPVDKSATVTVTFSGFTAETPGLELGFLVSLDPTFKSSKAVLLTLEDLDENGKATVALPVTIASKNYVKATASSVSGSNFSPVVELDVPSIPWYQAIASSYTGDAYSYWDETDCSYPGHTINVTADGENNTITFSHFDPAGTGLGLPCVLTGAYDEATRTVTIALAEDYTFDSGLAVAGYLAVPMTPDFDYADTYSVVFSPDYTKMTVQPYGLYTGSGWAEIYYQTTYVAN